MHNDMIQTRFCRLLRALSPLGLALFLAAGPAMAGDASGLEALQPAAPAGLETGPAPSSAGHPFGPPIDAAALDRLRGGADLVDNDIGVDGKVSDIQADGVITGLNIIQDGSFAGASGITTVIQNSGTGVLIQNAMIVNVQFTDAGP